MIHRLAVVLALALAAAPAALAAEPAHATGPNNVSVGIGVGVQPFDLANSATGSAIVNGPAPVSLYVPIQIGSQLRIEPSFGIWHVGGSSTVLNPSSDTVWSLGVGGMFYFVPPAPVGFYAGGRLGLQHFSESRTAGGTKNDLSATDFLIAPVLGAEYAVAPKFTVGAEFQLPITFYGNPSVDNGTTSTTVNADRTGVSTNAVVFLRYFFN